MTRLGKGFLLLCRRADTARSDPACKLHSCYNTPNPLVRQHEAQQTGQDRSDRPRGVPSDMSFDRAIHSAAHVLG